VRTSIPVLGYIAGAPADQADRILGRQRQDDLSLRLSTEGSKAEAFSCDFELHGQEPDHPLQLGDAVLVLPPLTLALEEALQPFQGDVLPAGDEFGLQLVPSGDLGLADLAREDFEDDLSFESRREGPAAAFRHGRALLGGQDLRSYWSRLRGALHRISRGGRRTPSYDRGEDGVGCASSKNR
jgi:hypothetical protein